MQAYKKIVGITDDLRKAVIKRRAEHITVEIPAKLRPLAEKYLSGKPGHKDAGTELYRNLIKNLWKI